jgi:predicted nuclease with TOPRIM domain
LGAGHDYPDAVHLLFDASEDDRLLSGIRETFKIFGRSARLLSDRLGLEKALSEGASAIHEMREALSKHATEVCAMQQAVAERTGETDRLHQALQEREAEISASRQAVAECTGEIDRLHQALQEREAEISASRQAVAERTGEIDRLHQALQEREAEFSASRQAVVQCSGEIDRLHQALQERASTINELQQRLSSHSTISASRRALMDLGREVATLRQGSVEREEHVRALDATISALRASTSWRIAAPLRGISTVVRRPWRRTRRIAGRVSEASTILLGKTILRLLPYYRRYLPERTRRFVSPHLPAKLKRPAAVDHVGLTADYNNWILRNDTLTDHDRHLIRAHIASFRERPAFSILMPVYNTSLQYLCEAIVSVANQLYGEWELCVVDDASTSAEVHKALRQYARRDRRIKVHLSDTNSGLSACTNKAMEMATGEWIVLMDHDDMISAHALYLVAEAINRHPNLAIIYSDEDHMDEQGRRGSPYFKPDWDHDLFLGQNMIGHLG